MDMTTATIVDTNAPTYDTNDLINYLQQECNYGAVEIDEITIKAEDVFTKEGKDVYRALLEAEIYTVDGSLELFFDYVNNLERLNEIVD